ncbi:MAG: CRISPR-associated helicase/endonuclease Cas3 [Thiotrichaceae bacterium]|nr:CRISPR-associated helicase/endonuclease Cas3 [Thiotrichaceae bacterium]
MTDQQTYYKYWGKARKEGEEGVPCHLLPYHCLDVASVADIWWEQAPAIQRSFIETTDLSLRQAKAWLLFFIALHDYGKLDMRFQLKAPKAVKKLYPEFDRELTNLRGLDIRDYFHGPVGFSLIYHDLKPVLGWNDDDQTIWDAWQPWLAAVTGHHGVIPDQPDSQAEISKRQADAAIIEHDRMARSEWISVLEALFLKPTGLSINTLPPPCCLLLAGFCSVADWLGSNCAAGAFEYEFNQGSLSDYYQRSLVIAQRQLDESGLLSTKQPYQGIEYLLPKERNTAPRQLQTLVDQLPLTRGLTLVEAPTGSGKTETALAYAWRLLDNGLADSIIFALPTQATANAMLKRLEVCASLIFNDQPNLVLAHGKSEFNEDFWQLKNSYQQRTEQGREEARVQCAEWLSTSRKRTFLGQIGVCTVDQVLISVLPVRHKFVRGFGIGKSILIVDEVHAYDSYMYGLLGEVLTQQQIAGGSALLLSATLPFQQRNALSKTWGGRLSHEEKPPYPLVTHVDMDGKTTFFELPQSQQPEERVVAIEVVAKSQLLPDDDLIQQMIQAAKKGAQVVFICNLVDVAQNLAKQLKNKSDVTVDLFHARYRFCDRQTIEKQVLDKYGKEGKRAQGSILIATQVVEQSLDLDFDWMITQLCPVDLLFQRLGRLHRHERPRPAGFKSPKCTVLIPNDDDYGYHGLIYGNTRVLWRTAQMLLAAEGEIHFPTAYRDWIERVYLEEDWGGEPEDVLKSYDDFLGKRFASRDLAKMMINSEMSVVGDTDENVSALTRDGEMSLNVLPVIETASGQTLLDGELIKNLDEWWRDEALNLNMVSVPRSWRKFLDDGQNGMITLPMEKDSEGVTAVLKGVRVKYSTIYGLEKEVSNG